MSTVCFDPTLHVPATPEEAAGLLDRAWEYLQGQTDGYSSVQRFVAVKDAQLILSVMSFAVKHPAYKPRSEDWKQLWPGAGSSPRVEQEARHASFAAAPVVAEGGATGALPKGSYRALPTTTPLLCFCGAPATMAQLCGPHYESKRLDYYERQGGCYQ